jgi:integrase
MNTRLKADITRSRLRVHSRPFAVKKPFEIIRRGSLEFRIYRQQRKDYESFTLAYRLHGRRRRIVRATRAALDREIETAEIAIANGDTAALDFPASARATYQRCIELAAGVAPLEILIAEAVEARRRTTAQTFSARPCPDIAAELIDTKRRHSKCGEKWLRALDSMLTRFAAHYTGPLHLLRAAEINAWLDSLKGGLIYRRHHRGAVRELANYAKSRDYIPRDWDELRLVDDPDPAPVRIRIWTPDQLVKLLAVSPAKMVPFITLQAFAGLRTEELVPAERGAGAIPLDWSDIDLDARTIHIRYESGKTGERVVPISGNLVAWLLPQRRESGPVCAVKNTANALTRIKRRAGLPAARGESRNVLRKSFISYRIGETSNRGQVAEEAGTSLGKIKSNYRRAATAGQAAQWFGILPTESEILQLDLFRRRA